MNFTSQKTSLLVLGITSLVCSRIVFLFLNDPEGPNLLVVIGMALIIYVLSLVVYVSNPSTPSQRAFVWALFVQILLVAGFSFFLR